MVRIIAGLVGDSLLGEAEGNCSSLSIRTSLAVWLLSQAGSATSDHPHQERPGAYTSSERDLDPGRRSLGLTTQTPACQIWIPPRILQIPAQWFPSILARQYVCAPPGQFTFFLAIEQGFERRPFGWRRRLVCAASQRLALRLP